MTALFAALAAAAVLGGVLLIVSGLRPVPVTETAAPPSVVGLWLRRVLRSGDGPRGRRRQFMLLLAAAGGLLAWLVTGLALMVLVVPIAAIGVPKLLGPPATAASIGRLEGLEEWTRSLAGLLGVGVGIEQTITASLRSAPAAIRPQVATLVARLSAHWPTEAALRAFADDLDDATGDLVAASLILAARRPGGGLVAVLEGLAASVAEDVRARRAIEADRAKPRSTARAVTFITLGVLAVMALNRTYVEPYTSPFGQALLAGLLTAYGAVLIWMRQMAAGRRAPRFLPPTGSLSPVTVPAPRGPATSPARSV